MILNGGGRRHEFEVVQVGSDVGSMAASTEDWTEAVTPRMGVTASVVVKKQAAFLREKSCGCGEEQISEGNIATAKWRQGTTGGCSQWAEPGRDCGGTSQRVARISPTFTPTSKVKNISGRRNSEMANDTAKLKDAKRMAKEDRSDGKFWAEGDASGGAQCARSLSWHAGSLTTTSTGVCKTTRSTAAVSTMDTGDCARTGHTDTRGREAARNLEREDDWQIRRWLTYRATKLVKMYNQSRAVDIDDPYVRLIAKFLKIERPPKARQASQEWSHEKYDTLVRATVNKEWAAYKVKNGLEDDLGVAMGFRGDVTRRLFKELVPSMSVQSGSARQPNHRRY
ncbi:hypothetical protein BDZ89DRAFT_1047978 [Hymenopellis radicata]|nr:hypothetical protein BDZ89DRAFT_1047978 [Hymenopellis radicata]